MGSAQRRTITYDPSLDGLRALAVIAVMLYHGAVSWIPGGYLGVDLFFVLSGFLITTLLVLEKQSTGRVSLPGFWGRRARRLLPALFLMLIWVLAYGAWIVDPAQSATIRRDALATVFYVANWRAIIDETSYFELFAAPSPLLHTWSLAIEEQWYLIWPILLIAGLRLGVGIGRRWLWATLALAGLSAVLMALLTDPAGDPSRAYYGTDTRLQALLIGAAVAFWLARPPSRARGPGSAPQWLGGALALGGLAGLVVLAAVATDTARWMYRGGFTLAALSAAALIAGVRLSPSGSWIRRLSALPPLPWIGRISYGLYLWHWPVFVFLTPSRTGLTGTTLLTVRFAATFAVAGASYVVVERPALRVRISRRTLMAASAAGVAVVAAAAVVMLPSAAGEVVEDRVRVVAASPGPERSGGAPPSPAPEPQPADEDPTPTPTLDPNELLGDLDPVPGASPSPTPAPRPDPVAAPGEPVRTLLVGDSVYLELATHFDRDRFGSAVVLTADVRLGCGIIEGDANPKCDDRLAGWRTTTAEDDPDIVLLPLSKWDVFDKTIGGTTIEFGTPEFRELVLSQLETDVDILGAGGARVLLVNLPCMQPVDESLGAGVLLRTDPARARWLNDVAADYVAGTDRDVRALDIRAFTCPNGTYEARIEGIALHRDGVHYSAEAMPLVWAWLTAQIEANARA